MRSFILDLTPERWEKMKASPGNFPITEADLPSQPEPGDTLIIRHLLPNGRGFIDLGDCVIAWAEPVTNHPHRYRLKVTFNMTPEQVKQRYGCPFTPLSDMLRKCREEKERANLEKARQILARKSDIARLYLNKFQNEDLKK
ncbi:hypothetical protein MZF08_003595 [Salmonella enterica]|uniref:Uncharacterized protein n=1 Tax=Salmonella enterica TaxID=28901 RepID=A0A626YIS9_SALER|nr:hypothetical protein [Salmonella enterica]EAS9235980.1 hypothetical protein [Salmonella enterica subsp. enterica]EBK2763489.1 hypothetical protein [Salmonella enterica subsp. enterica serovar Muenchen]EBY8226105.1 hypothetical protein [Salmonella enterica subsp. enterica serovar Adelaide]EJA4196712.1 hypothetical protein [Salmonella enterica subsp. diarizonae]EAR0002148.1 hypothetical protein [Salmonella enterica]